MMALFQINTALETLPEKVRFTNDFSVAVFKAYSIYSTGSLISFAANSFLRIV